MSDDDTDNTGSDGTSAESEPLLKGQITTNDQTDASGSDGEDDGE